MIPLLVRGFQSFRNLLGNRQYFVDWNGPLFDSLCQRRPFDQFKDQRLLPLGFF